jgi:trehalose/maltose transport system permease protein
MWEWMFSSTRVGLINVVFQKLSLGNGQIPFLASETWQVPAMIIIDVWKTTPFMALLLLAGLQIISKDLYEAANVDGAGKLRQFWSITLPLLRPTIAVALVFRTLDAVRVFDLFQIVLAQKRYSMASYAYYELINGQRMGYSSAASVVIFVVITIFAIGYIRLLGVDSD